MHQTVQYFEQLEQSERWQHKEHGVRQESGRKPTNPKTESTSDKLASGASCTKLHRTTTVSTSRRKKAANSSSHPKASAKKADKTKWTHVEDVVKSDSDPEYHYSRA
ncbi:hypothetical protein F441_12870 [Phytophthora nicotianae CJ01A1]|uniref:Uncharacterized protein n=1 Tax=Phytophthora nicotianae CJ01A1 TaxID=1317063 RepID=W2WMN8_PHYNI|nr:hypothetical protein F441_12870 [Phytophthora nicotianae CJ01A1]